MKINGLRRKAFPPMSPGPALEENHAFSPGPALEEEHRKDEICSPGPILESAPKKKSALKKYSVFILMLIGFFEDFFGVTIKSKKDEVVMFVFIFKNFTPRRRNLK